MQHEKTIWSLEHRWQGKIYQWRFERRANAREVTVASWEIGNLIKTRQCAIHTLSTARKLWDLIVSQGAVLENTQHIDQ